MATAASLPSRLESLPPLPVYRFSVDQYHHMADVGILSPHEPVELLDGVIVIKGNSTMAPKIRVPSFLDRAGRHRAAFRHPVPVRRFRVDEYRRMRETGVLGEEDRVELLEGWIVQKMTRNPPRDTGLGLLIRALTAVMPTGWYSRTQMALATDFSEPEPDLTIVRGSERDYRAQHPRPRDTALVVEVADTSLDTDRAVKGLLYARVGIAAYWILNVVDGQVEVYGDSTGPDPNPEYRRRIDYVAGEFVPLLIEGREVARIAVADLLP